MGALSTIEAAVEALGQFSRRFDPAVWSVGDARTVVELAAQGRRYCDAVLTLAAGRAAPPACPAGDHAARDADGRDDRVAPPATRQAAAWLAEVTGTTTTEAHRTLDLAGRIETHSATGDALRAGDLSLAQADIVTNATRADPTAEAGLLHTATTQPVKHLQRAAANVRAASRGTSEIQDRNRVHTSRYLTTWTTPDGAYEGRFRLPLDSGVILDAALNAAHDKLFRSARSRGQRPSAKQLDADALLSLARTTLVRRRLSRRPEGDPGTGPRATPAAATVRSDAGGGQDGTTEGDPPFPEAGAAGPARGTGDAPSPADPVERAPDRSDSEVLFPETGGESLMDSGHDPKPRGAPPSEVEAGAAATPRHPAVEPDHDTDALPHDAGDGDGDDATWVDGLKWTVHLHVDAAALQRGHLEPGETCEVDGIGPVPVAVAQRVLPQAFAHLVATNADGSIYDVSTPTRTISARLRAALLARDRTCAVPRCTATHNLEIHHLWQSAEGGPTQLDNLARVCAPHHDQITYRGAVLAGAHPNWTWTPPPP